MPCKAEDRAPGKGQPMAIISAICSTQPLCHKLEHLLAPVSSELSSFPKFFLYVGDFTQMRDFPSERVIESLHLRQPLGWHLPHPMTHCVVPCVIPTFGITRLFQPIEYSKGNVMSLQRLGYKKSVACVLGIHSSSSPFSLLSLFLGSLTLRQGSKLPYSKQLHWRGPRGMARDWDPQLSGLRKRGSRCFSPVLSPDDHRLVSISESGPFS
jgi:hypothetical protein